MVRSKGKKRQSSSRHEEEKRSPTSGKSQQSTQVNSSVVATSSVSSKQNVDMRTQASQGHNSNRRSLFMAGDLFKRNASPPATDANHAIASMAGPSVSSGTFTPERTLANQRLKDSDTASIRSNSSVRSNIAQRFRRVFSASNMFDKGRSNDSDSKYDRKKEIASGSRADTPDNIASQAKKQLSVPSSTAQSRSSTSTQRSRESNSQRRRAGSTSSERTISYQGYNPTTFVNGTSSGRPSFSSSSSSINSIQYRPGMSNVMMHTSSTGSANSLGQHSTTSFQPPRRDSASSTSTHQSRRSIYSHYNNEYAPNGSNGGNGSIYPMYGGENGSSTSLVSAPANVTSQHGNTNNNNGHINFARETRSASFNGTNGHSYSHYNTHSNGNIVNSTMSNSVNHRRLVAPSPLGSGHIRTLSFGSGTASTNYSNGNSGNSNNQQYRAVCSPQLIITPTSQMDHSNNNHLLHQQQFTAQPAPMMNANKMMNRHSWIPQVSLPASPYFSPANANSMSNTHPMNGSSHTPIIPSFPAMHNNQTTWESYRQHNLSESVLNTCHTGQLPGTTDGYTAQYANITPTNGINANTAQKTIKTLTITEQGGNEGKLNTHSLNNEYNLEEEEEEDDDDDDSYATTDDSEDEDEKPLGNRLFFGSKSGSQNGSNSSLASVPGSIGSTRNRPMPSRGILKVSGSSFGADMSRIPSSPAPWSSRNTTTNDQTSNDTSINNNDTNHDLGIESALSTLSVSRSQSTSSILSNEEESASSSSSSASSSSEALLTPASSTTTVTNIDQLTQVSSSTISASNGGQVTVVTPLHSTAPPPSSSSIHGDAAAKGLAMATPPLASNSATFIATSSVTTTEKETKRFRFNERVLVGETWHATEYDRRGESILRLTPALAQAIKMELNEFKVKEMAVHEESRIYTHILA